MNVSFKDERSVLFLSCLFGGEQTTTMTGKEVQAAYSAVNDQRPTQKKYKSISELPIRR